MGNIAHLALAPAAVPFQSNPLPRQDNSPQECRALVKASPMTPIADAMACLQARPFPLSSGQKLVDWLICKRLYPPHDAQRAREEYQRFLALPGPRS